MRNNGEALEQLIDGAEAIPHVVRILAPSQPVEVQEQGALLLSMLTSQFSEAKVMAVKVCFLLFARPFPPLCVSSPFCMCLHRLPSPGYSLDSTYYTQALDWRIQVMPDVLGAHTKMIL
jgi:hypothetical protein